MRCIRTVSRRQFRVGFIVNPIAGLGGPAGLRGTDAADVVEQAKALGGVPQAGNRAASALRVLRDMVDGPIIVFTGAGEMGERIAREQGLPVEVVSGRAGRTTTGLDTEAAARSMAERSVDLLVFAGGDGTARNICNAVGEALPVVGIPAGVKIQSAVYATNPRTAGELAGCHLLKRLPLRALEVMDIDEEALRKGAVQARLFGYLSVPFRRDLVQGVKLGGVSQDSWALQAIADDVLERLDPDRMYVLGPGTTTRAVTDRLGLSKTLLGVDVLLNGKLIAADVSEGALLELVDTRRFGLIVTPIGGQGHILGRGNQQIGPSLLKRVSRDDIMVVATPGKLSSLQGRPLRVDTGDEIINQSLAGHIRVITGYHVESICPLDG